jgi:hypothetical protein
MLQVFIQSFVRGEVTVGIVLTVLLITGRTDPQILALSLGGVGLCFLLQGLLPVFRSAPKVPAPKTKEQQALAKLDETSEPGAACARKPFSRRNYALRGALMSVVLIGTGALIYWLTPAAV